MTQEADNHVGYGHPPRESRFAAGKSGNLRGRPKKDKTVVAALAAELRAKITVRENGVEQRLPKSAAMAKALVAKALKGDTKAFGQIMALLPEEFRAAKTETTEPMNDREKEILERFVARRVQVAVNASCGKLPAKDEVGQDVG